MPVGSYDDNEKNRKLGIVGESKNKYNAKGELRPQRKTRAKDTSRLEGLTTAMGKPRQRISNIPLLDTPPVVIEQSLGNDPEVDKYQNDASDFLNSISQSGGIRAEDRQISEDIETIPKQLGLSYEYARNDLLVNNPTLIEGIEGKITKIHSKLAVASGETALEQYKFEKEYPGEYRRGRPKYAGRIATNIYRSFNRDEDEQSWHSYQGVVSQLTPDDLTHAKRTQSRHKRDILALQNEAISYVANKKAILLATTPDAIAKRNSGPVNFNEEPFLTRGPELTGDVKEQLGQYFDRDNLNEALEQTGWEWRNFYKENPGLLSKTIKQTAKEKIINSRSMGIEFEDHYAKVYGRYKHEMTPIVPTFQEQNFQDAPWGTPLLPPVKLAQVEPPKKMKFIIKKKDLPPTDPDPDSVNAIDIPTESIEDITGAVEEETSLYSEQTSGFLKAYTKSAKASKFDTLNEAMEDCSKDPNCGGITTIGQKFSTRKGKTVMPTDKNEKSWVKK